MCSFESTVTRPEIETAEIVAIRWDYFCATSDNTCDWFPNRKLFQVLDEEQLADLTYCNPTKAKESVVDANPCDTQTLDYQRATYITRSFLVSLHEILNGGREYLNYDDGVIRVREINVIA